MAEFKVDTDQLRGQANEIRRLQTSINEVALKLTGFQLGSVLRIRASTALIGQVSVCKWAAVAESADLGNLARGLDNAAEAYDNTEKKLTEPKTVEEGERSDRQQEVSDFLDTLMKIIGKANPIAALLSVFYYGTDAANGGGWKSVVDALKCFTSAAGSVGKRVVDGAAAGSWKDILLGLNDTAANMDSTTYFDFLKKEFGKYKITGENTNGQNISAGAKWAGVILSLFGNGIENYGEFDGDFTNARFWEETLVQTAVDVAKGAAISAVVAAALVAAFGSAPAVLVAVGAGAITVGVDWISEKVFGEKVTELVSDFVIDRVHEAAGWVAEGVENLGRQAAEGASAVWNSITGFGQQLFAWAG